MPLTALFTDPPNFNFQLSDEYGIGIAREHEPVPVPQLWSGEHPPVSNPFSSNTTHNYHYHPDQHPSQGNFAMMYNPTQMWPHFPLVPMDVHAPETYSHQSLVYEPIAPKAAPMPTASKATSTQTSYAGSAPELAHRRTTRSKIACAYCRERKVACHRPDASTESTCEQCARRGFICKYSTTSRRTRNPRVKGSRAGGGQSPSALG
ncbi:hypothetical protein C8R44DRAFT_212817 [Mycena epipterygia]|nr:hypothetical protein C8R44DRAFT_212817 [Mycena epipterygia]